jgi:protein-tyrosine phosphatase
VSRGIGSRPYRHTGAACGRHRISAYLDALADQGDSGALIHCSAGKDRTGWLCSMVLLALGVDRETIFEVRRAYQQECFDVLDEVYGSTEAYMERVFGFDAQGISALRSRLLTDG